MIKNNGILSKATLSDMEELFDGGRYEKVFNIMTNNVGGITVFMFDDNGGVVTENMPLMPFCWCDEHFIMGLGGLDMARTSLEAHGLSITALPYNGLDGTPIDRLKDGKRFLIESTLPMSREAFLHILQYYSRGDTTNVVIPSSIDMFMMQSGCRLFKGITDFNEYLSLCKRNNVITSQCFPDDVYVRFQLAKMLPMSWEDAQTVGAIKLWRSLLTLWSYVRKLPIPIKDEGHIGIGGMSKMFSSGYFENVIKIDYNSFYPSIAVSNDFAPSVDITHAIPAFLSYMMIKRSEYEEELFSDADSSDRDVLRHMCQSVKTVANSLYGAVSSNYLEWNDFVTGAKITATGRILFRGLIHHFRCLGYKPIMGVTDGCDFVLPELYKYSKERPYVVIGDDGEKKEFTGYAADIMEYNSKKLYGVLNVGVEDVLRSVINIKRGNYLSLDFEGNVNVTGSKARLSSEDGELKGYVSEAFQSIVRMMLENKPYDAVNIYRDAVMKAYNEEDDPMRQIGPLREAVLPLLVCFNDDIRKDSDSLFVKNPSDAKVFTEENLILVNEKPLSYGDEDDIDDTMHMEEKEVSFWAKIGEEKENGEN